jgi:hypothetical protein
MKTIVNTNTGKVLYASSSEEVDLKENEIAIDELLSENFVIPFFNFQTRTFYEGATEEEISQYQKTLVPQIITRRQFKIALAVLGKNENDIIDGINQLPEPTKTIALISYTEAGTFERTNQELVFVGKTFLEMTDEEIDNVFVVGSQY